MEQFWHEPRRRSVVFVHFYVLYCNEKEAFNNIGFDSLCFPKCEWKGIGYRLHIGYRLPCSLSISASAISAKTHIGRTLIIYPSKCCIDSRV